MTRITITFLFCCFTIVGFSQKTTEQSNASIKPMYRSSPRSKSDAELKSNINKLDKEISTLENKRDQLTDVSMISEFNEKLDKMRAQRNKLIGIKSPTIKNEQK